MMLTEALRRLDRVDAVLIDPRALSVDDLRVSRFAVRPNTIVPRSGNGPRGSWNPVP